MLQTAVEQARAAAQRNAADYAAAKNSLRATVERQLGATPAPTNPTGAVPTGPQEGSEYTSNGKTYRIKNGKPERIK
jgi:outer membrane protein TolC